MTIPAPRTLVRGIFLFALVFHVAIGTQDFAVLAKNGFLYDDSFYAFKIARNIASGLGITFDGVHATNGFQPLYVFLLVPVFFLAAGSVTLPIHIALALSALFAALSAVLLYKMARRYAGEVVAALCAVLWALSPVVTRQTANGLETSLALFLFAAGSYVYVTRIRQVPVPSKRDLVLLGVVLGLAVLARVDEILLALAMLVDYVIVSKNKRPASRTAAHVLTASLFGGLAYAPWLIYSVAATGGPLQDSGLATRYLSLAYAPFLGLGTSNMLDSGPSVSFMWAHLLHSLAVLKIAPPVHVFFRSLDKLGHMFGSSPVFHLIGNLAGIGLLVLLAYCAWGRKGGTRVECLGELRFLCLFSVFLISVYSFYVFGAFFFIRYYYPVYFISCLYAAFILQRSVDALRRRPAPVRFLAAAVFAAYLAAFAFMSYSSAYRARTVYYFYDVARWVDLNTFEDETIGVFQGGAIGYLSNRKVINLDGKVNREALSALKEKSLPDYLRQEGVDIVMDNSNVLKLFLPPIGGGQSVEYEQIMHGSKNGVPGWSAYRIFPTAGAPMGGSREAVPRHQSSNKPATD